jgi:chitinase
MNSWDTAAYQDFDKLKKRKLGLKTYISVGGWDAGGKVFLDMARFPATRGEFVQSCIEWMETHGFDGIDINREYPAVKDRGKSLSVPGLDCPLTASQRVSPRTPRTWLR